MPMAPSPTAETCRPWPSVRVCTGPPGTSVTGGWAGGVDLCSRTGGSRRLSGDLEQLRVGGAGSALRTERRARRPGGGGGGVPAGEEAQRVGRRGPGLGGVDEHRQPGGRGDLQRV